MKFVFTLMILLQTSITSAMLPVGYKKRIYSEYWKLTQGSHKFQVLFHQSIPFPIIEEKTNNKIFPEDMINDVVMKSFSEFNNFNLGVSLDFDSWDYTESTHVSPGTVLYEYHKGSQAWVFQSEIMIRMGLWEGAETQGRIHTLNHEILHSVGFAHKSDGLIKRHSPLYDSAQKPEFNDDDIHGLDVVYQYPSKYIIKGKLSDIGKYKEAEAYLVNKRKNLKYQSPIDKNGYFEFRLRKKMAGNEFRIFVLAIDENNIYHYSKTSKKHFKKGTIQINIGELKKEALTLEEIEGVRLDYNMSENSKTEMNVYLKNQHNCQFGATSDIF